MIGPTAFHDLLSFEELRSVEAFKSFACCDDVPQFWISILPVPRRAGSNGSPPTGTKQEHPLSGLGDAVLRRVRRDLGDEITR
jgi:hypothetical protein